ncbi:MAG: carboxypeptidase-like regulatory domain-containing protein [Syntrophales bacterium LBB04]|nr:carboxypeptidase-like regulatory domain-containing protein [Syntrophales bacterium LBB04]
MKKTMAVMISLLLCGYAYHVCGEEKSVLPIEQKEYQGIAYFSGGIGVDEREAMTVMGRDYSLKLMCALKSRAYLSDLKVTVSDGAGKVVLDAASEGPWFFAKLPPGQYTVVVTIAGNAKQSRVTIGNKQTSVRFYWDR